MKGLLDFWGVVALLILPVASSALGFAIYFTLLGRIGPIRLNFVSPIAAAVAAVGGLLALGEPVELRAIGAFVLIAAGPRFLSGPGRARRNSRGGVRPLVRVP